MQFLTVPAKEREGRIITFYSYKGGVGRTMAVANVAFLAALNGYKVLVMDWDLEAPGLYYHFRSLLEAPEAKALRDAPGVLNLFWDWASSIDAAQTDNEVDRVFERFAEGSVFEESVRNILPYNMFGHDGKLDFVNAGSPLIPTPELRPYEDALAHFSWPSFFEDQAGGSLIETLRSWAKRNYDFILLDSRTGLADVAGICTMQIPDSVALCFILNRQNIDGISKVSAAIRNRRQDEITLHAIPMRVAASDTGEEADARARGIHELTKIGGFSLEAVQDDFRLLSVRGTSNVPYYETVSPITATEISTDPLVLNYVRLATRILETPVEIPDLPPEWVTTIKRRLQPRNATTEYVVKLKAADPVRATEELAGFFESAFETALDGGELADDYVTALVDAAIVLTDHAESPMQAASMLDRALDLLRALAAENPEKWSALLSSTLERYIEEIPFFLEPYEEISLIDELDALLANSTSISSRLKRIGNRRRAARLFLATEQEEAASQTLHEINKLVKELRSTSTKLASDQIEQLLAAEVDAHVQRGRLYEKLDSAKAIKEFSQGLKKLVEAGAIISNEKSDLMRLGFEIHCRLALSDGLTPTIAAQHAVEAARRSAGLMNLPSQFVDLANIALNAEQNPEFAVEFCHYAFEAHDRRGTSFFISYFSRSAANTLRFFNVATRLINVVAGVGTDKAKTSAIALAKTVNAVLDRTRNKASILGGGRFRESLNDELIRLSEAFRAAGIGDELVIPLIEAVAQQPVRPKRPSR
ncbi:KGGVGR-motif variant AAA ATPase [Methylocystis parvus]|uniref:KGGVGR-motif variant AAA ATPase n=1 Tax=Methylocystis parvus TaxID=134 RepID=UPI003C7410D6